MSKWHRWTDEEREIIRRDYKHTHESSRNLADILSRRCGDKITQFAVVGQITIMGIAKRDDRRRWTPEEKERLPDLIHQYCPRRVAKIMHRSINSVVVQSKRLGISRRDRDGWFTKREVCEILGMDHHWVQRRIDSGALKATYHTERHPGKNGNAPWHIDSADLVLFIRKYPEELNGRNVDLSMIVDLLAGIINGQKGGKGID